MNDARIVRKVFLWNVRSSKWGKKCAKMVVKSGLITSWAFQQVEGRHLESDWSMIVRNGEGREWNVRKWRSEIDRVVKGVGLDDWRNRMEQKSTLEWYREKEAPRYVKWYEGSLGGDLLFRARAQCMDVNARNYRWSESRSKVCQMCNMGEDETVEHVVLECEKYARDRYEMMQVVLRELGHDRVEMTGREWMVVLLGLCGETNERMIEAVKEFLERMWRARCRN